MTTLAVTIGIGEEHARYAQLAAARVEQLLGLETFIIDGASLPLAIDVEHQWEQAWSLKFRIFDIIPPHHDRVMYFDCDWRPVRPWDVDALFPDRAAIYAVPDLPFMPVTQRLEKRYGLPPGSYFNAGWMILPRNATPLLQHCFTEYHQIEKAQWWDQCVFNQVFAGHVTYAPETYNVLWPVEWPDPVHLMAVHHKENYALYNGEQPDRQWVFPTYADEAETALRALSYNHQWITDVEHIVEVNLACRAYAGGQALELGSFRGHATLALALAGLQVTSYDSDPETAHIREGLLERHGQRAEFMLADSFAALGRPGMYDVIMQDADHGDHVRIELQALWDMKLNPGGLLIVHDLNWLNKDALLVALQPADILVTEDACGRQMGYLWKPS